MFVLDRIQLQLNPLCKSSKPLADICIVRSEPLCLAGVRDLGAPLSLFVKIR